MNLSTQAYLNRTSTEKLESFLAQYENGQLTERYLPEDIAMIRDILTKRRQKHELRLAYSYQVLMLMSTDELIGLVQEWLHPDTVDIYGDTIRRILTVLRQRNAAGSL